MEPTQEQLKEFWEWRGLRQRSGQGFHFENYTVWEDTNCYNQTVSHTSKPPDIDLSNLFQYAVDWNEVETVQFSYGDDGHHCWIYLKKPVGRPWHGNGETDALALFWALWQVKEA